MEPNELKIPIRWVRTTALFRVKYTAMVGGTIVGAVYNSPDGGYDAHPGGNHTGRTALRDAKREVERKYQEAQDANLPTVR